MPKLLLTALLYPFITAVIGQPDLPLFYGEIREDTIRFAIIPQALPENFEGFEIHYLSGENWIPLNPVPIILSTLQDRSYRHYSSEKELKLTRELSKALQSQRLKEVSPDSFVELMQLPEQRKALQFFFTRDFRLMELSGFGLAYPTPASAMEYILYARTDKARSLIPLDTLIANDLIENDYPIHINGRVEGSKKQLNLEWTINLKEYEDWKVLNGFNIYKQKSELEPAKLNITPIWMKRSEETGTIFYSTETPQDSIPYIFSIRPVTIFNTEGNPHEVPYNPASPENEIKPDVNIKIKQSGNYIDIDIEPKLPFETLVARKTGLGGDWIIMDTLEIGKINYTDSAIHNSNAILFYRLQIMTPPENSFSNTVSIRYIPFLMDQPKLQASTVDSLSKRIYLTINYSKFKESNFNGFQVLSRTGEESEFQQESIFPLIQTENFEFDYAKYPRSELAVVPIHNGKRTIVSNSILVPKKINPLPKVVIVEVKKQGTSTLIRWSYSSNNSGDKGGFLVYINDELYERVSSEKRVFKIEGLEHRNKEFKIVPFLNGKTGIESNRIIL